WALQRRERRGSAEFNATEDLRGGMGLETREGGFDAEARRRGGKRGERMAEMGGRRVPGGVEKVKGLRSAETAEDGSLRAGAERFPESSMPRAGPWWNGMGNLERRMPPRMEAWQPERLR